MKKALVIGSGAGGAAAAHMLAEHFEVTILEAGKAFEPFSLDLTKLEPLRRAGLFFDERLIQVLFPAMKVLRANKELVIIYGKAVGGTTTLATGNALRYDADLQALGICLDEEFNELEALVPQTVEHQKRWSPLVNKLYEVFDRRGFAPKPLPKMMDANRCTLCGRCALGCRYQAKWDSSKLLASCDPARVQLRSECFAERLNIQNNQVMGVQVKERGRRHVLSADVVLVAAGGLGTPLLLERSGLGCNPTLFVDPVLCVCAPWKDAHLDEQLPMPFVSQRDGYILSPYFDFLSFYFNKDWRRPSGDIMSIMIKLADEPIGSMSKSGIDKQLSSNDHTRLKQAVEDCNLILEDLGANRRDVFLGTINAGHPGGALPLSATEAESFHHATLPENLYLADATLFPDSLGNPPILTIMALARRAAKKCAERFG